MVTVRKRLFGAFVAKEKINILSVVGSLVLCSRWIRSRGGGVVFAGVFQLWAVAVSLPSRIQAGTVAPFGALPWI